jgi:2-polyprenyl-6-hydroxyphenyl methylase / 3-demethylubiquinone-9 3-methyltransferase
MKKISQEIYEKINNHIYDTDGGRWWSTEFSLHLLRALYNPFRVSYAKKIIEQNITLAAEKINVLEVGCGGGILTEEIARLGFNTTGIDPSISSLNAAIDHSNEANLKIKYEFASGENMPFPDKSFNVILCCDVLEHVQDLPAVVSEISRVLRDGGIFIYDTFNRTLMSKISAIKILQEWKRWAIMPPNIHVWEMFIKPQEMKVLLKENRLIWKEHKGLKPSISYLRMLNILRERALGKLTYEEFGEKFLMVESASTQIIYMGYALKS